MYISYSDWMLCSYFILFLSFISTESTLEIEIKGWGLGLDKEGSETLVAKVCALFPAYIIERSLFLTANHANHHPNSS